MSAHTHGPWEYSGDLITFINANGDEEAIAQIFQPDNHDDEDQNEAEMNSNGALLSAAPDLLEALQMLMPFAPNNFTEECQYTKGVWKDAADAIAKATGGNQP